MFAKNACQMETVHISSIPYELSEKQHWMPDYLTGIDTKSNMLFVVGMFANPGRRMLTDRNY